MSSARAALLPLQSRHPGLAVRRGTRCGLARQPPASSVLSSPSIVFFAFQISLWHSIRFGRQCGAAGCPVHRASVLAVLWHDARGRIFSPVAPASSVRCSEHGLRRHSSLHLFAVSPGRAVRTVTSLRAVRRICVCSPRRVDGSSQGLGHVGVCNLLARPCSSLLKSCSSVFFWRKNKWTSVRYWPFLRSSYFLLQDKWTSVR